MGQLILGELVRVGQGVNLDPLRCQANRYYARVGVVGVYAPAGFNGRFVYVKVGVVF